MTRPIDIEPTSDVEVFEMLHGLFGIGDYAEDDPKPWHHMKIVEIGKIKAMRSKRHLSFEDFALVARFCARRGVKITSTWQLFQHFADALRDKRANERSLLDHRIQDAVEIERGSGRPDSEEWIDRLLLSSGPGRQVVLEEWEGR